MSRPLYRHPGPAAATLNITAPDQADPVSEIDAVRWMSQMRADLAETLGGIMLRGARPCEITALPTVMSSSPGRLVGWSIHETSGTSGYNIRFRNGIDGAQPLLACSAATAGATDTRWLAPGGISFTEGLYVELVAGISVEGTVYIGAAD